MLPENTTHQNAWDKQPNEPELWYSRFDTYRSLGSTRTLESAFNAAKRSERFSAARPGAAWHDAARRYQWRERAESWDEAERVKLRSAEQTRRFDAREQRIGVTRKLLDAALRVIEIAELPALEISEARDLLPTIRMLLRDALTIQRQEFGAPTTDIDGKPALPAFTADDLIAAQRQLDLRMATDRSQINDSKIDVGDVTAGNKNATIINVYPNSEPKRK